MHDQHPVDFPLLFIVVVLAGAGLVTVYSASMYDSMQEYGNGLFYVRRHAMNLLLGLVLMVAVARLNYRGFATIAPMLLAFGFVLLGLVLVQKEFRHENVWRWLRFGGHQFQPSELMKLILVIYLAAVMSRMGERIRDFRCGFLPMLGLVGAVFASIILEPDLGVAGLALTIGFTMLFLGRAKLAHIALVTVPAALMVGLVATTVPYMQRRIMQFTGAEISHQVYQSLIGIGSGGIFGAGLGNSTQKFLFLPEHHTDFIFSIFAEETGFIGSTVLIFLFCWYVVRGVQIAGRAPDLFGFLLAGGIAVMAGLQIFINIGVAIRILPTTGITLPFMSYGGSSLLVSFLATGILLNISRQGAFQQNLSREFGARLHVRGVR